MIRRQLPKSIASIEIWGRWFEPHLREDVGSHRAFGAQLAVYIWQ